MRERRSEMDCPAHETTERDGSLGSLGSGGTWKSPRLDRPEIRGYRLPTAIDNLVQCTSRILHTGPHKMHRRPTCLCCLHMWRRCHACFSPTHPFAICKGEYSPHSRRIPEHQHLADPLSCISCHLQPLQLITALFSQSLSVALTHPGCWNGGAAVRCQLSMTCSASSCFLLTRHPASPERGTRD